jgi:hypothetical protein
MRLKLMSCTFFRILSGNSGKQGEKNVPFTLISESN